MHDYKAYTASEAAKIIFDEVVTEGESYWTNAEDDPEKLEVIKTVLGKKGIVSLDDMFGTWAKAVAEEPLKEYSVTVKYNVRARNTAVVKGYIQELGGEPEILSIVQEGGPGVIGPPLHITYYVKGGVLYYEDSDRSKGSTPNTDKVQFEKYWTDMFPNRVVTFEDIS